jgi:streptogramin lyase
MIFTQKRYIILTAILSVVLFSAVLAFSFSASNNKNCISATPGVPIVSKVKNTSFGGITKFQLPAPDRWPNSLYVDSDGSVWFGEWALPGIAHLFPWNGTLVEYPWLVGERTETQSSCAPQTSIWSVIKSGNYVWATSTDTNQIIAFNLKEKKFVSYQLPEGYESPYTISPSPDGSLWFTMFSKTPVLGQILPNNTIIFHRVQENGPYIPSSVVFLNRTLAYFTSFNPGNFSGYLFKFNPSLGGKIIIPERVEGMTLLSPNSIAYADDALWITEHGPSDIISYNIKTGKWTIYPTSLNRLTNTALPYFVAASNGYVFFNEHYGNKIGIIQPERGFLTEYSESNPPVTNVSQIDNVLTIYPGNGSLWFASVTSNYVGYLNLSARPNFTISVNATRYISLGNSDEARLKIKVSGEWSRTLRISFADTENFTGSPKFLNIKSNLTSISPGIGEATVEVTIKPLANIKPGEYTVTVTVDDGLLYQSAYFFVRINQ